MYKHNGKITKQTKTYKLKSDGMYKIIIYYDKPHLILYNFLNNILNNYYYLHAVGMQPSAW